MKKFVMTVAIAAAFVLSGAGVAQAATYEYAGGLVKVGSTGSAVMDLQTCMNELGYNTGVVDGIFGYNTAAGVKAFQASKGLAVDGIIGPMTGPQFTMACAGEDMDDEDEDDDSSDFDINNGDEADFSDFDLDDADDDTIEEGEDEAELAEYVFELEDEGAAMLERLDVVLTFSGTDDGDDTDAWDVFNNLYLMVDGDVIAEIEADDEDDWDDTSVNSVDYDEARLRISGINHAFEADDEHTIVLAADISGSVDLGTDDESEWTVRISNSGMRFVDEAGITVYLAEEAGTDADTAVFTIEAEGQDDELDVQSSNDDPDSTTLKVEDDQASDDYTVFVFELEADEDSSDIELDKVGVTVTTGTATFDNVVKDAVLVIDGEEFDDIDTYTDGTTVTLVFDIDKDFTVDSGDTVDAELVLEFKSANGVNYTPGETVQASVLAGAVTGEGADDLVAGGSATGDVHTLLVEGIKAETTSTDADVVVVDGALNDYAEFELVLDVEAFEDDAYISENAATAVVYTIVDANTGAVAPAGTVAASISSSADLESGFYRINENDTESLTLTVSYTPGAAGSYRLRLDSIEFASSAVAPTDSYVTIPAQDFRTGNVNITG